MYIIYSTPTCSYCKHAKDLLTQRGLAFEERPHTHPLFPEWARTVPQIYVQTDYGTDYIGGYEDLVGYLGDGE